MSTVNVRYMVDDVDATVAWYTKHLGFTLLSNAAPAFADVTRGSLRLLLSGPTSSAGRAMPDGDRPRPGGWNRIHLIVDDLPAEVARLRAAGVRFRNDIVTGPGGSQILLIDPSGNLIELFQPARRARFDCCVFLFYSFSAVTHIRSKDGVIGLPACR
jgi:catechol 2,3-dioxygenase-like lactoylglutathione lyase family enzyme